MRNSSRLAGTRFVALMTLLLAVCCAHGGQRAVLIGVSAYDNLPPYQHLRGPKNDVTLLRSILLERGFETNEIIMLADGVEGATKPTRAAILKTLDAVANEAKNDDFVFVHFSGHGTQQPSGDDDRETDGLDEVFLPADAGEYLIDQKVIENAISDDEIGARFDRIRARGAFIWAVFDTCHAGTMTRASAPGERSRRIDPADLGVPTKRSPSTAGPADEAADATSIRPARGGLVAFYAAQSLETTPELSLPIASKFGKPQGLFTYNIAKVLMAYPDISYRQAAEQVLRNYNMMNRFRPTPVFEGSALDSKIFSFERGNQQRQYPLNRNVKKLELRAGLLHLIEPGSVLAVMPRPTSADEDRIGYVEVVTADAARSTVRAIDYGDMKRFPINRLPPVAYARLVEPRVNFTLRVSAPANSAGARVGNLLENSTLAKRLKIVAHDEPADLYLRVDGNLLRFLPIASDDDTSGPSLDLTLPTETFETELLSTIERVARAINLLRLAEHLPAQQSVQLSAKLAGQAESDKLQSHEIARLRHGDELELKISNPGYKPVDVTMLFIDSDYRIGLVYPRAAGELNRIEPRGGDTLKAVIDTSETAGRERLVMLAVAAEPGMPVNDFSFLAQSGNADDEASRGEDGPLSALFRDAGFGLVDARGLIRPKANDLQTASLTVLSWHTEGVNKDDQ